MNIYSDDEVNRIKKATEKNKALEEFFETKRTNWNENIEPIFKTLNIDFTNPSNAKKVLESQALALSYRQVLNEEINLFLNKRSQETSKAKKLRQDKFIFYATGFPIKTNLSEKAILIDGNLAENDRMVEIIETHVDFLRSTIKNLESFSFAIKNMVDLIGYLGK